MKAPSPDSWPASLLEHIRRGGAVRSDPQEECAGRCGALNASDGSFCRNAAGKGTAHAGVGPCHKHLDSAGGLPPWVGVVDPDRWRELTGGGGMTGPDGRFVPTHGASKFAGMSLTEIALSFLDADDGAVFSAIPADPIEQIEFLLKLAGVQVVRIHRWIAGERAKQAVGGGSVKFTDIAGAEALAAKISGTQARLHEVLAKYREIESANDSRAGLRDVLARMSPAQMASVVANPALLADFQIPRFSQPN